MEKTIHLNNIDKIKSFVNDANMLCTGDIDLISGKYVIDAKSIMGIFSLDLSKPITVNFENEDDAKALEKYFAD